MKYFFITFAVLSVLALLDTSCGNFKTMDAAVLGKVFVKGHISTPYTIKMFRPQTIPDMWFADVADNGDVYRVEIAKGMFDSVQDSITIQYREGFFTGIKYEKNAKLFN